MEKSLAISAKFGGDKVLKRSMKTMEEEPLAQNKMQYEEARVSDIEGVQDGENGKEKGESEDKQDNMIIEILGLKEGNPTVELPDCRSTKPEQLIRTQTPLKDVINLEQVRESVGKVEEGKNGKGHWKRLARNVTVDTKSHRLHGMEACEASEEKKRLREQMEEGDMLGDSVIMGKKSKMGWQLAKNLHTMVGETSLNWSQVNK